MGSLLFFFCFFNAGFFIFCFFFPRAGRGGDIGERGRGETFFVVVYRIPHPASRIQHSAFSSVLSFLEGMRGGGGGGVLFFLVSILVLGR